MSSPLWRTQFEPRARKISFFFSKSPFLKVSQALAEKSRVLQTASIHPSAWNSTSFLCSFRLVISFLISFDHFEKPSFSTDPSIRISRRLFNFFSFSATLPVNVIKNGLLNRSLVGMTALQYRTSPFEEFRMNLEAGEKLFYLFFQFAFWYNLSLRATECPVFL